MSPLLFTLLTACRPAEPNPVRVIVAIIDGVRLDESFAPWISDVTGEPGSQTMPRVWSELIPEGTLVLPTHNLGTTITAPAHCAMLTGSRQRLVNYSVDSGPGLYRPDRPTLGEELRRQRVTKEDDALLMANADLVWPMEYSLMPGYGEEVKWEWFFVSIVPGSDQPASDDMPVLSAMTLEREDREPRLMVANLKEVDRKGHYGESKEEYVSSITELDDPIADLWEELQRDPLYQENTILVITSDHGRHRLEDGDYDEDYWRNHGDPSAGDREIPLFLMGPGVPQGLVVEEAGYTMEDIAPTIASLMGLEMPWARGLTIEEAVQGSDHRQRSGLDAVASDGPFLVEGRFSEDPRARQAVFWEDLQLSSEDAWVAEAPSVADRGDGTGLACWREIAMDPHWLPWVPVCAELDIDQGSFTLIEGPEQRVGPFWRPSLRADAQGRILANYIHNPDDIGELGIDEDVAPRTARWDGSSWTLGQLETPEIRYPTDVHALDLDDEGQVLWAFGGNPAGNESRHKRRIYLQRGQWTEEGFSPAHASILNLDSLAPVEGFWRLERPRLRRVGEEIQLVAQLFQETGRAIVRVRSLDEGETWLEPELVVSTAGLYPQLPPLWLGDQVAWMQHSGAHAEVCVEGASCLPLDTDRVADWSWSGDSLHLVHGNPDLSWTLLTLEP